MESLVSAPGLATRAEKQIACFSGKLLPLADQVGMDIEFLGNLAERLGVFESLKRDTILEIATVNFGSHRTTKRTEFQP